MAKQGAAGAREKFQARMRELATNDPQIKALAPSEKTHAAACEPGLPYEKVIAAYLDGYAERPALGERAYEARERGPSGETAREYKRAFAATSYRELHARIKALAMAWRTHPHCRVMRGELVGIMGFASVDYAVVDMACAYAKAVTVPLSGASPDADLTEILSNAQPAVLAASVNDVERCAAFAAGLRSVTSLLVFDFDARIGAEKRAVKKAGSILDKAGAKARLVLLSELVDYGKGRAFSFLPSAADENESLAMIMHSSGSTGKPKGACVTARALINTWRGQPEQHPRVTLIMAPFNHNMGRNEMYETLNCGGTAYFTLGRDMSTLFEDIRLVRPTVLVFFPRILEMIHQHFLMEAEKRTLAQGGDRAAAEAAVMAEMRASYLGDRLLSAASASAPVSPDVRRFFEECFGVHLVNGYGATEAGSGGLALDGRINRRIVLDYKIADVPELGYFTTDKPHPRGEFRVKTRFGVKEYFKQPEATAGLFDEDGFALTGDIVEELGPDHIAIIDRKTNVLKLAQGEYVALGALEKLFAGKSALLSQIYLYASGQRSYPLAVVVPDMAAAGFSQDGLDADKVKNLVRAELNRVGEEHHLKNFEVPRDFILEFEPFSQENGLLSSVNKFILPAFRRKYGPRLEAMYADIERRRKDPAAMHRAVDADLGVRERLAGMLGLALGRDISEDDADKTFYALGGDSLGAALFSLQIEEAFTTRLGGDAILSPTGNIRQWARAIERAGRAPVGATVAAPTGDAIHGNNAHVIHADDLALEKFLDQTLLREARALPDAARPPGAVLLTGATGFLGHALCLAWLKKLAKTGGKLVCIVRAQDDAAARNRLERRFAGKGGRLEETFRALSQHLEVVGGDSSEAFFGLDPKTFARLSEETDRVCHAAALVNHRLGYRDLFAPNVRGTAEAVRFALSRKKKPLDFISTIGVNELLRDPGEDEEHAALLPSLALSDAYAAGYIAGKWASEHLLGKAHDGAGLPVAVFRCDMIMPDSRGGLINESDLLSRLLYSVAATGIAPESFYDATWDGAPQAHFCGLPVDVLADAIVGAADFDQAGFTVYNAYNYLKDGVSLDAFATWIKSAGYALATTDFDAWREEIEKRLAALPLEKRRRSIHGVMDAFQRPFPVAPRLPACANFKALLRRTRGERELAGVTEAYIHDYLRALFADAPGAKR